MEPIQWPETQQKESYNPKDRYTAPLPQLQIRLEWKFYNIPSGLSITLSRGRAQKVFPGITHGALVASAYCPTWWLQEVTGSCTCSSKLHVLQDLWAGGPPRWSSQWWRKCHSARCFMLYADSDQRTECTVVHTHVTPVPAVYQAGTALVVGVHLPVSWRSQVNRKLMPPGTVVSFMAGRGTLRK